jgi:carbonic anhydrase
MTVDSVRKNSAVLAELERNGTIKIVGAMYNLQTAALEFLS